MKAPSPRGFYSLLGVFALLMIATRVHHLGSALHLPDASMAVFFLAGLYLRRHLAFIGFIALAAALDWAAISYAGVSDFCVTAAYSFLLPAYAALWYGGRWYAERLQATAGSMTGMLGVALVAASLSFVISNGSFYWLGGRYAEPHFAEYVARLWQWGPLFVRTTMVYIAIAAAIHLGLAWARRSSTARA